MRICSSWSWISNYFPMRKVHHQLQFKTKNRLGTLHCLEHWEWRANQRLWTGWFGFAKRLTFQMVIWWKLHCQDDRGSCLCLSTTWYENDIRLNRRIKNINQSERNQKFLMVAIKEYFLRWIRRNSRSPSLIHIHWYSIEKNTSYTKNSHVCYQHKIILFRMWKVPYFNSEIFCKEKVH